MHIYTFYSATQTRYVSNSCIFKMDASICMRDILSERILNVNANVTVIEFITRDRVNTVNTEVWKSTLVVTQPSTSHHLLCGKCVCITALSGINYMGQFW